MPKQSKVTGYIIGIVAAAAFGFNPLFAVPLMREGMDAVSVLFFRYLFAVPAIYLLMRARHRHAAIGGQRILAAIAMGILMAISSLTLFESYNHMDVGIASTLLFVYPLMVAVIMVLFFHEVMTAITLASLLGTLGGVWLLCVGDGEPNVTSSGIFLILGSALAYALYIVGVNRPPLRSVATLSLTFWVLCAGAAALGIYVICRGKLQVPHNWWMWCNVVLLALVPTMISLLCTNSAIEKIGPTPTAILGVFEPLTAVLFGALVFDEHLSVSELLGMGIILGCVAAVIGRGTMRRQILSMRKMFPIPKTHRRNSHKHSGR